VSSVLLTVEVEALPSAVEAAAFAAEPWPGAMSGGIAPADGLRPTDLT
jgi:hypothetical protein